jgi:O-antigen/teichoic acid export membrane protein
MMRVQAASGIRHVARNASFALLLRIAATALTFAFNLVLARSLGREGTGVYYLSLSIIVVVSILCRLGFDNALVRHVAADIGVGDVGAARGLVALARNRTVAAAAIVSVLGYLAAPWVASAVFHNAAMTGSLRWMMLGLAPFSLYQLNSWALKGAGRPVAGVMVAGALPALVLLSALLLALRLPLRNPLAGPGLAFMASSLVVWSVSIVLWRRAVPADGKAPAGDGPRLFASAWPLLVVALSHHVMKWTDMYVLGILLDTATVGSYAVAVRTADLTAFVLFAVNATTAPRFSALHAKGDLVELGRFARRVSVMMALAVLPFTLALLLAPGPLLGLFGQEFRVAAGVLQVLALGQFVNVYTGPVGQLLMMTGHEKDMRDNALIFAGVSVLLNLTLIPAFGALGAAVASGLSLALRNLYAAWLVKKRLGFVCLPLPGRRMG